MGCRAITPHLVSLARDLEGKPFHLLAAHCQNSPKSDVLTYIKSKGLAADTPNFTVSSFGGHPGVKGNGYVPYYMVFDHTGQLRHHHMCGAYHGGDGLKMIEWVEQLLDEAPALYLGEEAFEHIPDLAKRAEAKKALGEVALALEAEPTGDGARRAEVDRLLAVITAWRDREIAGAERLLASKPNEVVERLEDLAKELAGSRLVEPVEARAAALDGSDELKAAIDIQKTFEKAKKKISKLKVTKALKKQGFAAFDLENKACRDAHRKTLDKTAAKLRAAVEGREALPISTTALAYAARLES